MNQHLQIESLEQALRAGPALRLAVLFGSAACDELRPDSDVDIAILPEDLDLSLDEELAVQVELVRACGRDVDLVRLDHTSTLVRWQVARHGRALLECRAGEFARFRARSAAEYMDFAPQFERMGELFRRRVAESAGGPT